MIKDLYNSVLINRLVKFTNRFILLVIISLTPLIITSLMNLLISIEFAFITSLIITFILCYILYRFNRSGFLFINWDYVNKDERDIVLSREALREEYSLKNIKISGTNKDLAKDELFKYSISKWSREDVQYYDDYYIDEIINKLFIYYSKNDNILGLYSMYSDESRNIFWNIELESQFNYLTKRNYDLNEDRIDWNKLLIESKKNIWMMSKTNVLLNDVDFDIVFKKSTEIIKSKLFDKEVYIEEYAILFIKFTNYLNLILLIRSLVDSEMNQELLTKVNKDISVKIKKHSKHLLDEFIKKIENI